jgi:hypothetical protein
VPNGQTVPTVGQQVLLYEEDPSDPQGKRYTGSAIWRTETVSTKPGLAPRSAPQSPSSAGSCPDRSRRRTHLRKAPGHVSRGGRRGPLAWSTSRVESPSLPVSRINMRLRFRHRNGARQAGSCRPLTYAFGSRGASPSLSDALASVDLLPRSGNWAPGAAPIIASRTSTLAVARHQQGQNPGNFAAREPGAALAQPGSERDKFLLLAVSCKVAPCLQRRTTVGDCRRIVAIGP